MHDDEGDRGEIRHSDADPGPASTADRHSSPNSDADAGRHRASLTVRPHSRSALRGETPARPNPDADPRGEARGSRGGRPPAGHGNCSEANASTRACDRYSRPADSQTLSHVPRHGGRRRDARSSHGDVGSFHRHSGASDSDPCASNGDPRPFDTDRHLHANRSGDSESDADAQARRLLRRRRRPLPSRGDLDSHSDPASQAPLLK